MKTISFFLFSIFSFISVAIACPKIEGVPDVNCDGQLTILALGDSLVYGKGDTALNDRGGWVARSARKYPTIKFHNFGKLGLRSKELINQINGAISKNRNPTLQSAILAADIVVFDLGRNDRWLFGLPLATYRNLKRASSLIKNYVAGQTGIAPVVVTAVLMLPNRGSQGPWVKELNTIILRGNSINTPNDLRFDLVSKRLLSSDQIHPTSAGYAVLAKTFLSYLTRKMPGKIRAIYVDTDGDLIPDIIETVKFGTSITLTDTDGDGKSDYDELFTLLTNPLVID